MARGRTGTAAVLAASLAVAALLPLPALGVERFAVIVGNDSGRDFRRRLRFAEDDAAKVQDVLLDLGRFPRGNTILLRGKSADEVRGALLDVERRLATSKAAGEQSLLVFFYSGHSDGEVLELGDTSLRFDEVSQLLKASSASVRVALIDSCQSGRLVASKGVTRGPAFPLVKMDGDLRSTGYAIITSSASDELSQESAEIRGSYFTQALVSALRGAGDRSGDGAITLSEAYNYAYERTLARTSASVGGAQHPGYDFQLRGRGDVVMTETREASAQVEVQTHQPGRLLVLTQAQDRVLAEVELAQGQGVRLALAAGPYVAMLLSQRGGELKRADFQLAEGEPKVLTVERDFKPFRASRSLSKGGLLAPTWGGEVGVAGIARRFPLGQQLASGGVAASVHLFHSDGLFGVARLALLAAPDVGVATEFRELGGSFGLGYRWVFFAFDVRASAHVGLDAAWLSEVDERPRTSLAPSYLGQLAIAAPISHALAVQLAAGAGGRWLVVQEEGLAHQFDAQLLLGLAWSWDSMR